MMTETSEKHTFIKLCYPGAPGERDPYLILSVKSVSKDIIEREEEEFSKIKIPNSNGIQCYIPTADEQSEDGIKIKYNDDKTLDEIVLNEWQNYHIRVPAEGEEWLESWKDKDPVLKDYEAGPTHEINFGNYVGHTKLIGCPLKIDCKKLSEDAYKRMLDEVISEICNLIYDTDSQTFSSYQRVEMEEDVLYHQIIYLLYMFGEVENEKIPAQKAVRRIIREPYRERIKIREERHPARVRKIDHRTLRKAVGAEEYMEFKNTATAPSMATKLGKNGPPRLPTEMDVPHNILTVDTAENRFVKLLLRKVERLLGRWFDHQEQTAERYREELERIDGEVRNLLNSRFFREVGPPDSVPLDSQVLQKSNAYRVLLNHYLNLNLASTLPVDDLKLEKMLENRAVSELYELWSLFEVKNKLEEVTGQKIPPGYIFSSEPEKVIVERLNKAKHLKQTITVHNKEIALFYEAKFLGGVSGNFGSDTVNLLPDIVLAFRPLQSENFLYLILDAKFKYVGKKDHDIIEDEEKEKDEEKKIAQKVKRADIYKMHTYRDALPRAIGAFALFPGSKKEVFKMSHVNEGGESNLRFFEKKLQDRFDGVIGGIPLKPGDEVEENTRDDLSELFRILLG